jgi:hypothetical protein
MLLQAVIGTRFESPEDLRICPLCMAIASGVGHRCKAELGANALAVFLEDPTCKLGSVVRNDTVWDPKSTDDGLEEGDSRTLGDVDHGEASGHLVNLSMATKRYRYPPTALGNGPRISTPIRRMAKRVESFVVPRGGYRASSAHYSSARYGSLL